MIFSLFSYCFLSLSPIVFKKMLKLPDPTLTFNGEEARDFLKKRNNGLDLLQEYLKYPSAMPIDITRIHVSSLENPY